MLWEEGYICGKYIEVETEVKLFIQAVTLCTMRSGCFQLNINAINDFFPEFLIQWSEGGIRLSAWVWGILIFQLSLATFTYLWMLRRKGMISLHIGMNVAMVAGGGISLGTGVLLIYEFPFYYIGVTGVTTLIGMVAGGLFGRLFGRQSMLSGYVCGFMTGMMAPMIGAAAFFSIPFAIMIEFFIVCSFMILLKETYFLQVNDGRSEK